MAGMNNFLALYHAAHAVCPKCGSAVSRNYVGYALDHMHPENYKNKTDSWCKCGWRGIGHDLVPIGDRVHPMCFHMSESKDQLSARGLSSALVIKIDYNFNGMHWPPLKHIHPMCKKMSKSSTSILDDAIKTRHHLLNYFGCLYTWENEVHPICQKMADSLIVNPGHPSFELPLGYRTLIDDANEQLQAWRNVGSAEVASPSGVTADYATQFIRRPSKPKFNNEYTATHSSESFRRAREEREVGETFRSVEELNNEFTESLKKERRDAERWRWIRESERHVFGLTPEQFDAMADKGINDDKNK